MRLLLSDIIVKCAYVNLYMLRTISMIELETVAIMYRASLSMMTFMAYQTTPFPYLCNVVNRKCLAPRVCVCVCMFYKHC